MSDMTNCWSGLATLSIQKLFRPTRSTNDSRRCNGAGIKPPLQRNEPSAFLREIAGPFLTQACRNLTFFGKILERNHLLVFTTSRERSTISPVVTSCDLSANVLTFLPTRGVSATSLSG